MREGGRERREGERKIAARSGLHNSAAGALKNSPRPHLARLFAAR